MAEIKGKEVDGDNRRDGCVLSRSHTAFVYYNQSINQINQKQTCIVLNVTQKSEALGGTCNASKALARNLWHV